MQVLVISILLGCLAIFWLQNPQSIALVLFGSLIPVQLSLGSWILISLFAGLISSFLSQFFNSGPSRVTNEPKKQPRPKEVKDRVSSRPYRQESEWEDEPIGDDWEIEKPPKPTPPNVERTEPPRVTPPVERTEPRQPSVYSYSPPVEPKKTQPPNIPEPAKPPSKDGDVYDANYRVITPPNKTQSENPDEEDWI